MSAMDYATEDGFAEDDGAMELLLQGKELAH